MKPILGISIYPIHTKYEDIETYLLKATELGFKKIFTSLFYLKNKDVQKYIKIFKFAKKLGFYIIADIGPEVISVFHDNKQFKKLQKLGIDCLRLDTPLTTSEILTLSKNFDIQINASFDTRLINELIAKGINLTKISVMHNFYPMEFTGLNWAYFHCCNRKWNTLNMKIGAFVTSQSGWISQQPINDRIIKLPTIEKHRNLPIVDQANQLLMTHSIKEIFVGNYPASDIELKELSKLYTSSDKIFVNIHTDVITPNERKIISFHKHERRGDLTDGFIRSVKPRTVFKSFHIEPRSHNINYKCGDVIIINNKNKHYKCELWIITDKIKKLNNEFNYVGYIPKEDIWKLDLIDSGTPFSLLINSVRQ